MMLSTQGVVWIVALTTLAAVLPVLMAWRLRWVIGEAVVVGADRIAVNGQILLLHGIKVPEAGVMTGGTGFYHREARPLVMRELRELVQGRKVRAWIVRTDRSGRCYARIRVLGPGPEIPDLSRKLIARGMAFPKERRASVRAVAENARHRRIGLWEFGGVPLHD